MGKSLLIATMSLHLSRPLPPVQALVLAAGVGRRFGADKRRARLPDGTPLLAASLARATRCFAGVSVVLRPGDDPRALGVPEQVRVVQCAEADLGMGHSLATGARALAGAPGRALAVLLGDMPWIAEDTLARLVALAEEARIVFPRYWGERGHPVLFGRDFWPDLETLRGDSGARDVLRAYPNACLAMPVDDPGVVRDVDRAADLAAR